MKIKVIRTFDGCPDGIKSVKYEEGKEYDVPAKLGTVALAAGLAEEVKPEAKAPENKAIKPAETKASKTVKAPAGDESPKA